MLAVRPSVGEGRARGRSIAAEGRQGLGGTLLRGSDTVGGWIRVTEDRTRGRPPVQVRVRARARMWICV